MAKLLYLPQIRCCDIRFKQILQFYSSDVETSEPVTTEADVEYNKKHLRRSSYITGRLHRDSIFDTHAFVQVFDAGKVAMANTEMLDIFHAICEFHAFMFRDNFNEE